MFFFDTCNAVAAREDRMRNYLMLRSKRSVLRRQCSDIYKSKYKKVSLLPFIGPSFLSNKGPISSKR